MSTDKTTPLILITGHPCTGKTTLGQRLAADLKLPFINKDGIKEQLFESLGWSDREASRRLAPTTFALLYHFLTAQLRAGQPCIAEANFDPAFATEEFRTRQQNFPLRIFQLLCYADGRILFERFQLRSESGERHQGIRITWPMTSGAPGLAMLAWNRCNSTAHSTSLTQATSPPSITSTS